MRIIMQYSVSDQCTYSYEVVEPIVSDSVEQAIVDFDEALKRRLLQIQEVEKILAPVEKEKSQLLQSINRERMSPKKCDKMIEKEMKKYKEIYMKCESLKPIWWKDKNYFQVFNKNFYIDNFFIEGKTYMPEFLTVDEFFKNVE